MDKIYEILLNKIDKKLSTKAFVCFLGLMLIVIFDYNKGILFESIWNIKIFLVSVIVVLLVYFFVIKKAVKNFLQESRSKVYIDEQYTIDCNQYQIIIEHRKECVLWNEKPQIYLKIINKSDNIIENLNGYIDLFLGNTCIIHQKIQVDYILPHLGWREKIVDNQQAYQWWHKAKFVQIESDGKKKVFSGPIVYRMTDLKYLFIKNKTLHVIKMKLERPLAILRWFWNGGSIRFGTKRDEIIRKIKTIIYRILIIAVGIMLTGIILFWLFLMGNEIYNWARLHIKTINLC